MHESSKESIPSLIWKLFYLMEKVSADLYIKSTDSHQLLYYTLFYFDHNKQTIVYRILSIVSED